MSSPHTLRRYYDLLLAAYGPQQWWPAETAFEVLIGAVLTQNTAWTSVERSIANLKAADALSLDALLALSLDRLRELIRPSGFMQRKALTLRSLCTWLQDGYNGSITSAAQQPTHLLRQQLLAINGIGPETADSILLYALGHPVFVVDEYLRRVVLRHALAPAKASYAELQQIAEKSFSNDAVDTRATHYNEFHALIVETGKRHCRRKPNCTGCPLENFLPEKSA
ncbi:MAG: base excision DNA repair protein [Acidobacteriaceae bacterium]